MNPIGKLLIVVFALLTMMASAHADSRLFNAKDKAEVEALLAKGANINAKDKNGDTMLHKASAAGKKDIVEWLLGLGADVNVRGADKETPLHRAAYQHQGTKDIAELLLAKGADVNARNREERPPLRMAVSQDNKDIVELLLAKGADVNALDTYGTPLHLAATTGNIAIAELLLAKGAQVNRKESAGRTALHFVAYDGKKAMAEWLLVKGADVNAKDKEGKTPLHFASSSGKKDIVELFLSKGADINAQNNYPGSALDEAMSNRRSDIVDLLERHMLMQARSNPLGALAQLTGQLKELSYRDGTRRLVIKLASELKPAPAIPEEARKHFIEGTAIVKAAKNPAQQALAAQSFTEALKVAPWWGDAYYNLGVAQELAEKYDEAEKAFNFYLLSNLSATERREVQDRIYTLSAKRKLSGSK